MTAFHSVLRPNYRRARTLALEIEAARNYLHEDAEANRKGGKEGET